MRQPSDKRMNCSEIDWMNLYFATEKESTYKTVLEKAKERGEL